MQVVVVGVGAIGGTVAGYLAGAGYDVTALDRWPEHVARINRNGLRVTGARGTHRFPLRTAPWDNSTDLGLKPELVFVCVKAYDTEEAAALVAPILTEATSIISTQNGLNEDLLAERLGKRRVVGAVTELGGYVVGPGEIAETRADGGFVIGELDGSETERVARVRDVLSACAPTSITSTIRGLLWSKLIWNCMMNPLTTLSGLGQGEVWLDERLRELALRIGREAATVAAADGAALEPLTFFGVDLPGLLGDDDPRARATTERVVELYRPQAKKSTSMREDVLHGRRTEIDFLNGHVVRRGDELGALAQLNAEVVRLVHAVERGELTQGLQTIELLEAAARAEAQT